MLVDTHCHIHEANYPLDIGDTLARARQAGVGTLICVGTSEQSSREAVAFATGRDDVYAAVGVHPHEVKDGWSEIERLLIRSDTPFAILSQQISPRPDSSHSASLSLAELAPTGATVGLKQSSVSNEALFNLSGSLDSVTTKTSSEASAHAKPIAIGEIGLDYFYTHSPREVQIKAFEAQMQLALDHNLPVIFHARDAFDDFWPIFDNFRGIRGVLHSFTDTQANLDEGLKRGLYIGVNGISTFTKDVAQQGLFASIPVESLLFETDAPFLTPVPFRGKVNEPAFVRNVADYHAKLRNISLDEIAAVSSQNAAALFALL